MSRGRQAERRMREQERLLGLLCDLHDRSTPTQDWLLKAGPIARRLNEESEFDDAN